MPTEREVDAAAERAWRNGLQFGFLGGLVAGLLVVVAAFAIGSL